MAYTVNDFCMLMEKLAPLELALEWDNVGLQIGEPQKVVSSILVTLTLTADVLEKALAEKIDLIISHHPLIFKPLAKIRTDDPLGAMLAILLRNNIAVYVAHTNLDQAPHGLNHWLAEQLGLIGENVLIPSSSPEVGLGRFGRIVPRSLGQYAKELESLWKVPLRIVGNLERIISNVAVLGGSGGSYVKQANHVGADLLITGDVSYHHALDAEALGLAVIDAGHFATEQIMVKGIADYLRKETEHQLKVVEETSVNPFRF